MSVTVIHHCNRCGAAKGTTNHWFAVRMEQECGIGPYSTDLMVGMRIVAFHRAKETDEHYCGEACLIAAVSEKTKELA